jgi:hypothetical protein
MAYSKDELLLKEMTVEYGTWANLDTLTASTDPDTLFTSLGNFGYLRMGSLGITLEDTFAEYKSGTPHKSVRMDLIERMFGLTFTVNQFNHTNLQIILNTQVSAGAYNIIHIGSDAPVKTRYGYRLGGTLVDGSFIRCGVWAAEVITASKTLAMSGTDYVDEPVEVRAFEHEDFITTPDDQKNYGAIWLSAFS